MFAANDRKKHTIYNLLHSVLLLAGMSGLLCLLGWMLFGLNGVIWAFLGGLLVLAFAPRLTPRAILRFYGARPLSRHEAPALYQLLDALSQRAGLSGTPALFYVPSRIMNAFAVGSRDDAAVAVSDGLLRAMSLREMSGILAHEISHIRNNDMWVMGLADVISRLTSTFSLLGQIMLLVSLPLVLLGVVHIPLLPILVLIAAPLVSTLLQLALSRRREMDADEDAAILSGDPRALAAALEKLERYQGNLLERIFLPGRKEPNPSVLRTHPDTRERVGRLLAMASTMENDAPLHAAGRSGPAVPGGLNEVLHRPRWRPMGFWR